ncbi:hypothetical protein [Pyruvatibacter mobilis]|uniref:hypothetical protein n=1 Tax=Pyruvatibacter mobilis TaxID=1712261 RepID=UPI003BAD7B69
MTDLEIGKALRESQEASDALTTARKLMVKEKCHAAAAAYCRRKEDAESKALRLRHALTLHNCGEKDAA